MKRAIVIGLLLITFVPFLLFAGGGSESKEEGMTVSKETTEEEATEKTGIATELLEDKEKIRQADESVTGHIVYWTWDNAAPYYGEAFTEKYPNATIEVRVVPEYFDKLKQVMATGVGVPDVAMIENNFYGEMANSKVLTDLTPYGVEDMKDQFLEFWFESGRGADGVMRVMPNAPGMAGNFYKRDLAKIMFGDDQPATVEENLKTWDDVYQFGMELKEKTNGEKFIVTHASEVYSLMLAQSGKSPVVDNVVNLDHYIEPMKAATKFRSAGLDAKAASWTAEWSAAMKEGSVFMYNSGSWFEAYGIVSNVGTEQDGEWGVAAMPGGNVSQGGNGFAIPAAAGNKDLAWKFIEFATTDMDMQADQLKRFSCYPGYIPAQEDAYFALPVPLFNGQKARLYYGELASDMVFVQRSKWDNIVTTVIGQYLENVFNGEMTAEEALEKTVDQLLVENAELSS